MTPTKEYLHEIFNRVVPEPDEETGEVQEPYFTWAVSPDGNQPVGTIVNTSPIKDRNSSSRGIPATGHIRVRGMLFTVEEIERIYEI